MQFLSPRIFSFPPFPPAFRNPPGSPFHLPPPGNPYSLLHTHGCIGILASLSCVTAGKSFSLSEPQLYIRGHEPTCGQPGSVFCGNAKKFLGLHPQGVSLGGQPGFLILAVAGQRRIWTSSQYRDRFETSIFFSLLWLLSLSLAISMSLCS